MGQKKRKPLKSQTLEEKANVEDQSEEIDSTQRKWQFCPARHICIDFPGGLGPEIADSSTIKWAASVTAVLSVVSSSSGRQTCLTLVR